MMSKYSYKDIKSIINNTPAALRGLKINDLNKKIQVGYYHPSNANWCYLVYVVDSCDSLREVVAVFGEIK